MLVDGFCRAGKYERARSILHAVLMSRHCPRFGSFNNLVSSLLRGGSLDEACFLLEEMEERNMDEMSTYNSGGLVISVLLARLARLMMRFTICRSPMAISIKSQIFHLTLALLITFATSARLLDETVPEPDPTVADDPVAPVSGATGASVSGSGTSTEGIGATGTATVSGSGASTAGSGAAASVVPDGAHPDLTFFMHDIIGGTNPSAKAITGIVTNPAVNGQVPFAKPNGAVLPANNGLPQNNGNNGILNNNNVPFLTGLGGVNPNVMQNNGNNNFIGGNGFPVMNGGQLSSQSSLQQLMFGTMIAIDDELTESHVLGSGMVGRAQGFYVYSSVDGKTQTMAFTTMFQGGGYVDSLNFFGVHQTSVSESFIAVMGGTGKYVSSKGFALVKTLPAAQQETDGLETVLEFNVYLTQ